MDALDEPGWQPRRDAALAALAPGHRIGPHQLGGKLRDGRFGPVWLALHPEADEVRELEHYEALADRVAADPDGLVMQDIAQLSGLGHRHLSAVLAAGWHDDAPYVVRPHALGLPLDAVLAAGALPLEVAIGVVYAVAEALAYLAEAGPAPGACAHGGVTEADLFCGYDGRLRLLGGGLRRIHGAPEGAADADAAGLRRLAARHGVSVPDGAPDEVARHLRRTHRDAAGLRHRHLGRLLRARFDDRIDEARAQAGLSRMQ